MVQKESRLNVADNCGVWSVGVFHIYRGFRHKIATTNDFVRVSLKKTKPANWLRRGKKSRAFIVRVCYKKLRKDSSYIKLLSNDCLLLKKRMTPRGREILGPITYGIRKKKVLASFIGVI
jgi:ribosomal protein L14